MLQQLHEGLEVYILIEVLQKKPKLMSHIGPIIYRKTLLQSIKIVLYLIHFAKMRINIFSISLYGVLCIDG